MVAFFDQDLGDRCRALAIGAYVDVISRLNLARRGHNGSQIFFADLARLDDDNTAFTVLDAGENATAHGDKQQQDYENSPLLFQMRSPRLKLSDGNMRLVVP